MSLDPATSELIAALDVYVKSVRLSASHTARITVLCHRVEVLSNLGHELYANLQVQQEAAKEAIEITSDPEPPAYKECLATFEDYKVVYRLMQAAVAEAVAEKDFIDWHAVTNLLPEYETAMKLCGGGK